MKLSEIMKKYYNVDLGKQAKELDEFAESQLKEFERTILCGSGNKEPTGILSCMK